MKRLLTLLFLMASFLMMHAQSIRNVFYGCTLGKTTQKEFFEKMKEQGLTPKYDVKNRAYYLYNVSFAGEVWTTCSFEFYDDKLLSVGYGMGEGERSLFEQLASSFKEKYAKMITNDESNRVIVQDKATTASTSFLQEGGKGVCVVTYSDIPLSIKQRNDRKNDI